MATWTSNNSTIKFDDMEAIPAPAGVTADGALEQWRVACRLAQQLRASKVVGEGTTYTVNLSGTYNAGHPNGDSVTITVTNAN